MNLNTIIHADVLSGLEQIPAETFHCVITSPPYWRLRSYPGVPPTTWSDGQTVCLGAEADPDSFIRHLVEVFDGVRRVLREDGVCFVNIGETYASQGGGGKQGTTSQRMGRSNVLEQERTERMDLSFGLKPGDRCGIPERFALAMQAAGWWWRDTIVWAKKSPMPSSQFGWRWVRCRVKVASRWTADNPHPEKRDGINYEPHDGRNQAQWSPCHGCPKCEANNGYVLRKGRFRTTAAHEPIFVFAKGERYFMDDRGAAEKTTGGTHSRGSKLSPPKEAAKTANGHGHADWTISTPDLVESRNPRSVWSLSNEPTKEKHFAAFPTALVKKCMDMATSKEGCCSECGLPYAPIVESQRVPTRPALNPKQGGEEANRDPQRHIQVTRAVGYLPTCTCEAESVPCRVLDPFMGSGTTARVAHHTGRDWVGIEASEDYIEIAHRRIQEPLPRKKNKSAKRVKVASEQKPLFT